MSISNRTEWNVYIIKLGDVKDWYYSTSNVRSICDQIHWITCGYDSPTEKFSNIDLLYVNALIKDLEHEIMYQKLKGPQ